MYAPLTSLTISIVVFQLSPIVAAPNSIILIVSSGGVTANKSPLSSHHYPTVMGHQSTSVIWVDLVALIDVNAFDAHWHLSYLLTFLSSIITVHLHQFENSCVIIAWITLSDSSAAPLASYVALNSPVCSGCHFSHSWYFIWGSLLTSALSPTL